MPAPADLCPCGSRRNFYDCCEALLQGIPAPSAEALMRSRYTAYVIADEAYLLASWHASSRPQTLELNQSPPIKWAGLKILDHTVDADCAERASVEFIARYKVNGKAQKMHELSRFLFENGQWVYLDGKQIND